jgi:hypothetical protein
VNEANRRSQIRAAVEAGKQAELEKALERAAARQHQAAPGPGNEKNAAEVRDPNLGQGPLTYEDRLSKGDMAGLAFKIGSLGIAAAAGMHVPHMDLPDEISDAVERSSLTEYPFSRLNVEVALLGLKEKAKEVTRKAEETLHVTEVKETAERFRSRVEDARYPAQRDEQRREDRAMSHPCAMCKTPTPATHVMTIQKPGLDPVRAYACEADAKWIAKGRAEPGRIPPPNMDPKKVEKLRPVMADKTVTIRGTRMPETPDRSPAGGGPGGRSMVPDPKPAPKRTPPPQPNRGSRSDWGRLAIGSGGLALIGREGILRVRGRSVWPVGANDDLGRVAQSSLRKENDRYPDPAARRGACQCLKSSARLTWDSALVC